MAIPQTPRGYAIWAGLSLLAVGIIAFSVAWSGIYNVAASRGHWTVVAQLLRFGMKQSVDTYSLLVETPDALSDGMRRLGGAHYHLACVQCHGAPGFDPNPITTGMLPQPPALAGRIPEWKDRHLFWITKHGLKYTGMPGWPVQSRDDEVWSIVAFLRELPTLDRTEYAARVRGNKAPPSLSGRSGEIYSASPSPANCSLCHGDARNPPTSALVPRLAGQRVGYLAKALREYASGERPSGIMKPVASVLTGAHIQQLAEYYSELQRPGAGRHEQTAPSPEGERIARFGIPDRAVPACLSCHDTATAEATSPRLAGQSAAYIELQLRLWRQGVRSTSGEVARMTVIASRLPEGSAREVARYLAGLPPMQSVPFTRRSMAGAPATAAGRTGK